MEFKVGDWVVNLIKGSKFFGCIGQVQGFSPNSTIAVSYEFKGDADVYGPYLDYHLRHATPQEVAHHFAEEICDGV
jgi:hypothetical protein